MLLLIIVFKSFAWPIALPRVKFLETSLVQVSKISPTPESPKIDSFFPPNAILILTISDIALVNKAAPAFSP